MVVPSFRRSNVGTNAVRTGGAPRRRRGLTLVREFAMCSNGTGGVSSFRRSNAGTNAVRTAIRDRAIRDRRQGTESQRTFEPSSNRGSNIANKGAPRPRSNHGSDLQKRHELISVQRPLETNIAKRACLVPVRTSAGGCMKSSLGQVSESRTDDHEPRVSHGRSKQDGCTRSSSVSEKAWR